MAAGWAASDRDLGDSLIFKQPVAELLADKAVRPPSSSSCPMAIALALAVPLVSVPPAPPRPLQDNAASTGALLGVSLPDFFWICADPDLCPLAGLVSVIRLR